ncbi:hypothetical protein GP486_007093 [Trichoglossum hirsutum]|uniref:NACHT domain-containing protein n=1 Tax=Trichoglossum hirsutum TaxID=265104 RepID=A0A9P8IGD5_9PEZI|nr:hypothetical protein GP486_007093 [Trichoglossum hirsutum]
MEKLKGVFNPRRKKPQTAYSPRSRLDAEHSRWSSKGPPPNPLFPDGVEVLHDCPDATVDICFVHGLTGDRVSSWTAHGQTDPWPKTLLPPKLSKARILTYGYDAYIVRKLVAGSNRLIDHAANLLHDLTLGGLVCKEAILLSRNNPEAHLRGIFDCTRGIIFMGTPHKGAWMANWARIPASALGLVKSTNTSLLKILETDDQYLESIQVRFWSMIRELREAGRSLDVTCFFEELPSPVIGEVVSKDSATLEDYNSVSIRANHEDMVKFSSERDNGFKRLLGELIRWESQISTANSNGNTYKMDERDLQCLKDLRATDPYYDKMHIEKTKGGLLKDSYVWILENADFQQWRNGQQSQLLWIKGDPGKGKTMLLCGIADELKKSAAGLVSFFFLQSTDLRINNPTAVLRGLIYLLASQQPLLIHHVRKKYDHAGKELFTDSNAWFALSDIFTNILEDLSLKDAYMIIDALDECKTDLPQLLDFIVQKSSAAPHVKWVVSSRNWPDIEERLEAAGQKVRMCLELNAASISTAVGIYIRHKVRQLAQLKNYEDKTTDAVREHLSSNANDTFLWVALVCQNLEKVPRLETLAKLSTFPPGLDSFYERMIEEVYNSDLCKQILAFATSVYRPITLHELASFIELPDGTSNTFESWEEAVRLCGSFLTLRERTVYFVHQSAKDFLLKKAYDKIFPSGIEEVHHAIFSRSLHVMSKTLRRDIYGLGAPGFPIERVRQPEPDPLAAVRYSCIYWVDHLCDFNSSRNTKGDLQDHGAVDRFLRTKYIYWLEALSLLRSMSEGVISMTKLENAYQVYIQ